MVIPVEPASLLTGSGSRPREGSRDTGEGIIVSVEPDMCWTPMGGGMVAVPYRIWARQRDVAAMANSVRQTSLRTHVRESLVLRCYGDEPGTGGGVISGTTGAECTPKTYSATVFAEGRNVARHDDDWWMNHRNTFGRLYYTKDMGQYEEPDPQPVEPVIGSGDDKATLYKASWTGVVGGEMAGPAGVLATSPQVQAASGAAVTGVQKLGQGLMPAPGESFGTYMQRPLENLGVAKEDGESWSEYWQRPLYNLGLKQKTKAKTSTESIVRTTAQQREDQKKCPCTVEPYSVQRTKCPTECEGSQAHHIVPDYLLGPDNRAKREQGSRIYTDKGDPLTSFQDGPSICLIGNKSTAGTPHNIAHGGDRQIQDEAAGNSGVTSLGQAVDISVLNAIEARPECKGEILTKTYDEFGKFDENTSVRGTNNPIKEGSPASELINTTRGGSQR